jgi:hypothetical protein
MRSLWPDYKILIYRNIRYSAIAIFEYPDRNRGASENRLAGRVDNSVSVPNTGLARKEDL